LSPLVEAAAGGVLPEWAEVSAGRIDHSKRVAELLTSWAGRLDLSKTDQRRWRAAGWLHDALRDAEPDVLLPLVSPAMRDLPGPVLHGPAAATRLRGEADEELRTAIRYHTIGHPQLLDLGRALYLADYLEPGRSFLTEWRAELRARMPAEMASVLREVIGARIRHLIDERKPIRPETAAFWSRVVSEERG
jgi:HD superfamily phosphohydrolase YqeK